MSFTRLSAAIATEFYNVDIVYQYLSNIIFNYFCVKFATYS